MARKKSDSLPKKTVKDKKNNERDLAETINKDKDPKLKTSDSSDIPLEYQLNEDNYIVGVGASAGGLEALESFFKVMPPDGRVSFVVIQHLSPDYKSLMAEILSKHTKMKVIEAEDGMEIYENHIYLIPRKRNMTIFHRKLFLAEQNHNHANLNLPIDIFLKSLAEDLGEKAVAIIFSGTGSDGTSGVRSIKEHGGTVIVQEADSAKFNGMPNNAISTGIVDYILKPEEMPYTILKHVKYPRTLKYYKGDNKNPKSDDEISKIMAIIKNHSGVDFTYYKPSTIIRRIEHRMSINQIDNLYNYLKLLNQSQKEVSSLSKELLIGVTQFFRDPSAFKFIQSEIIPRIFSFIRNNKEIRVWVPGCSTGEEAYTLAILFMEYIQNNNLNSYNIKIFATDVDNSALEYAGAGQYPESVIADIEPERLKKFFLKKNEYYQVNHEIREMVIFARHNVIKDPPFSRVDLISCRNLLIYLQPILQKKIIENFIFSLNNNNSFMFLGPSESIHEHEEFFESLNSRWKIYKNKGSGGRFRLPGNVSSEFTRESKLRSFSEKSVSNNYGNKTSSESISIQQLLENILKNYHLACVIVDENIDLIQAYGNINEFVKIPTGNVNLNLLQMVDKELNLVLNTSIHKCIREQKEIKYSDIQINVSDTRKKIKLNIIPFIFGKNSHKMAMVIFDQNLEAEPESFTNFEVDKHIKLRMKDLEYELQFTKENLKATVEELETSNEELQATNEELLAANQELQSTNEELQSVNEELITVNSEYQSKIGELTELNNDMNSLYSSTEIGAVFLDKELCIKKFTSGIKKEINIIERDIGRPISHISHNLKYNSLEEDVSIVMENGSTRETEVESKKGDWYLLKIQPYLTTNNIIKGVIILLINISRVKKLNIQLDREKSERMLFSQESVALKNISDAVIILDKNLDIISWNNGAEKIYKWQESEVQGKYVGDVLKSDFMDSDFESMLEELKSQDNWQGESIQQRKDSNKIIIFSMATGLKDKDNNTYSYLLINRDVTSYKFLNYFEYEQDSNIYEKFDTCNSLILVISRDKKLKFINKKASRSLKLKKKEAFNKDWFDFVPDESRKIVSDTFDRIISGKDNVIDHQKYPVFTKNKRKKNLIWNSYPLTNALGEIVGILSEGKYKSGNKK